jgi:hypothetical protein
MKKTDPQTLIDFKRDIELINIKANTMRMVAYRRKYLQGKKRGDYSYMVLEWDDFEIERDKKRVEDLNKKYEETMEDFSNMKERRILVRLSKYYNNAEVEVTGIESIEEFNAEKDWAKNECFAMINQFPNHQLTESATKAVQKETYVAKQPTPERKRNTPYEEKDVTTKFIKGKQMIYALKGLNAGLFTLARLNACKDWNDSNTLIFPPR